MTDEPTSTELPIEPITDLERVRNRSDVEYVQTRRAFPPDSFENLRARYNSIAGVHQVGVTTADGAVLLIGGETWSPLGGEVLPGEDWGAIARVEIETVTGVGIDIHDVERVVDGEFYSEANEEDRFIAPCVFFSASLRDPESEEAFLENPTFATDLDHPLYGDGSGFRLGWFEAVPDDAHPNHVDDIQLFLD